MLVCCALGFTGNSLLGVVKQPGWEWKKFLDEPLAAARMHGILRLAQNDVGHAGMAS